MLLEMGPRVLLPVSGEVPRMARLNVPKKFIPFIRSTIRIRSKKIEIGFRVVI